jgi:hypothetical protein
MNSSKKIDLSFGAANSGKGGEISIVVDLTTCKLYSYGSPDQAERVHALFDGELYYRSRSGSSGAGWVPTRSDDGAILRQAPGYRTDLHHVEIPNWSEVPEIIRGGDKILVPFSYSGTEIPKNWPIIGWRNGEIYLFMEESLRAFLCGGEFEQKETYIGYVPSPFAAMEHVWVRFRVDPNVRNIQRTIETLYRQEMQFSVEDWERKEMEKTNPFFARLGIWQLYGKLFKISKGVCLWRHDEEHMEELAHLEANAPKNVQFLSKDWFVQDDEADDAYVAVHRTGVVLSLSPHEYVQAVSGGDVSFLEEKLAEQQA